MENNINRGEESSLNGELQQGKEFARRLQNLLNNNNNNNPHSSSTTNTRDFLVQQIIASFDRATSMAHHSDQIHHPPPTLKSDSPLSGGASSPRSEDSDPIGDLPDSRTRKAQPRWKNTVPVSPETGFEGPPGDGYNWRKYGQKEILGADYPRAYYRCALKNQTNCSATKQVQRCDQDPSTFEVTYRGLHTCNHTVINPTHPPPSSSNPYPNQTHGKETLISFNQQDNPCFSPNPTSFHFHGPSSSGPTTAIPPQMPPVTVGAATSASATSSPLNIAHNYPFDPFDFDTSEFFH